jgi:hypothetical protein
VIRRAFELEEHLALDLDRFHQPGHAAPRSVGAGGFGGASAGL